MSRWTENTTMKFVEAYRERPCLWNVKDAIYKNKHARDTGYKEIENIMNIEGFGIVEIKNKIRALRSTYSQEKKKIKDSKKSGAGTDQVYVPNVKWFKEMDSFLHHLEDNKRKTEDNLTVSIFSVKFHNNCFYIKKSFCPARVRHHYLQNTDIIYPFFL